MCMNFGQLPCSSLVTCSSLVIAPSELHLAVPFCVYADEGQSFKKNPFMIVAYQPVIGKGTSFSMKRPREESDLGVNMVGSSCITRFLYSCMQNTLYQKQPAVFEKLMEHFSLECKDTFENGVEVRGGLTIYPTFIFAKGDWPMLRKMANLVRFHGRHAKGGGLGICHLCLGGTADFPDWHDASDGSWQQPASMEHCPPPWSRETSLTRNLISLSLSHAQRAWFYRPDIFHTVHKGVMCELAGSAIDSR